MHTVRLDLVLMTVLWTANDACRYFARSQTASGRRFFDHLVKSRW